MRFGEGTVLGVASLKQALLAVGAVLVILFTAVRPEASMGLGFLQRLTYWSLHIGSGLAGILLASFLIRRPPVSALPVAAAIAVTGALGAALAAPAYWAIEQVLPTSSAEITDDWLDRFALSGTFQAVVAEYLEAVPAFIAAWFAVNVPLLLRTPQLADGPPPDGPGGGSPPPDGAASRSGDSEALTEFLTALPDVVGRDVVAISSDLHYLNVHTSLGKATVLGSLKQVAAAFAGTGQCVHRSHWVARHHVERVVIAGKDAYCVMSTGLKVPVSRRKRKAVKAQYGQGVVGLHAAARRRRAG